MMIKNVDKYSRRFSMKGKQTNRAQVKQQLESKGEKRDIINAVG